MSNEIIACTAIEEAPRELIDPGSKFVLENPNSSFATTLASFFENSVPTFLYDPSFEDELRKFLAKHQELDALRHEYLKRLYSPFIVKWDNLDLNKDKKCTYRNYDIYLRSFSSNSKGQKRFIIELLRYRNQYRVIRSDDFRSILLLLSIPYSEWISKSNFYYVDLIEFLIYKNISYEIIKYSDCDDYFLLFKI